MNPSHLVISSLQNEQVKNLVKLRNRKERDFQGLTIIEEPLVIERALAAEYPFQHVYFCPDQLDDRGRKVWGQIQTHSSAEFIELTPPVMTKASYRDRPEGLLVVAPQVEKSLDDLSLTPAPLLVILEAVEKPGNLGAVLRIADGAGADAVLICGQGTDLFNPNVLRASRGAFFSLPAVAVPALAILEFCSEKNITTIATSPAAEQRYTEANLAGPVALVLGTEHEGLSDDLLNRSDQLVSIPMLGAGDSLNVASSAAVMLYEAVRQRSI